MPAAVDNQEPCGTAGKMETIAVRAERKDPCSASSITESRCVSGGASPWWGGTAGGKASKNFHAETQQMRADARGWA